MKIIISFNPPYNILPDTSIVSATVEWINIQDGRIVGAMIDNGDIDIFIDTRNINCSLHFVPS